MARYHYHNARGDARAHDLSPRLRKAGYLASSGFDARAPLPADPTLGSDSEGPSDPEEGTISEEENFRQAIAASLQPDPFATSFEGPAPSQVITGSLAGGSKEVPVFCIKTADAIRKDLPPVFDLDNQVQLKYGFVRFETGCSIHGVSPDVYVPIVEGRLDQPGVVQFAEKTRLMAVHNWALLNRDPTTQHLSFLDFKSVCEKVAGGETPKFSRKTLAALSQKTSGSFHQFLSDFETQAAYVRPRSAERLELFMAGLNNGLKGKVLCRPDGTDWTSWKEFLTVVTRHADAELRSREPPAKVNTVTSDRQAGEKRAAENPQKKKQNKSKKAKQSSGAGPSVAAAASTLSTKKKVEWAALKELGNQKKVCTNCLQGRHTDDRNEQNRCSRPRVEAADKYGAEYTNIVRAMLGKQKANV